MVVFITNTKNFSFLSQCTQTKTTEVHLKDKPHAKRTAAQFGLLSDTPWIVLSPQSFFFFKFGIVRSAFSCSSMNDFVSAF